METKEIRPGLVARRTGELLPARSFLGAFVVLYSLICFVGLAAEPPAASAGVQALAAEVRDKGWICYSARSTSGDWDLFLCRPGGSQVRNISRNPDYNDFSPQFSRNSSRLLYRRIPKAETIDNNRHGEQGELVISDSDGSASKVLGKPGEFTWASWSPDGNQIATLSIKGVFIIDLETMKVVRQLERKGFFQQLVWSPDGQWLCGVANSFGASWSVARMNAITGEGNAVNVVDCCTPDWFPDSKSIIFSWRPPGQKVNNNYGWTQLWKATADGKSRELVYGEDGRHVYGGHVSPDGKYVLFTGNMEEDGDPAHGGGPMGLLRLADGPIIGGESKTLRALYPEAKSGPSLTLPAGFEPCWTYSELPGKPSSADKVSAAPLAAELHHRGWLVFSSTNAAGDWDLYAARPDGTERQALTDTREFHEAGARFSPDGFRLLYYRIPRTEAVDNNTYGTFELVIANGDGTQPDVFGKEFPWACWAPSGRQFACLTAKAIRIVDLATRQILREIPRNGIVEQLCWAPNGKRFVGTANGLGPYWNIGVLDVDTLKILAVSETERFNCTPDWCPDSERIVYARGIVPQQPGYAELWVANANGTDRHRLYSEKGMHIYGACSSPDQRYLLFTRSLEDLGKVPEIQMSVIRWPQGAPANDTVQPERLDLGHGWEPHWTPHHVLD